MPRGLRRLLLFIVVGVIVTVLVAVVSTAVMDLSTAPATDSANAGDGRVDWSVQVQRRAAGVRIFSQRSYPAWCTQQAAGPPDTSQAGDISTAWASATPDGQAEWLEVEYDRPLIARELHIYETYNPGALRKATLITETGAEVVGWEGKDPTPTTVPIGLSKLPVGSDALVRSIRIDLDSVAVKGWNEIDAVGLLDDVGVMHWARRARASSSYATSRAAIKSMKEGLVPGWASLGQPSSAFAEGNSNTEVRVVEGRGWPFTALWAETSMASLPPLAASPTTFQPMPAATGARIAGDRVWPRRVAWSGLAMDSALFAAAAAAASWLLTRPKRFLVESSRIRRGCCLRCGYDLRYDFVAGCPECGWRRQGEKP